MALDTKLRAKGQQPGCQDTSAHITSVSRPISLIAGGNISVFYITLRGSMWHQPSEISPFANLWSFPQFSCFFWGFFHKQDRPLRSRERSAFLFLNQKHSHVHLTQSGVSFNTVGNHITRLAPAAHDTGSGPIHAVMKRDSTPNPFKTPSPPCST